MFLIVHGENQNGLAKLPPHSEKLRYGISVGVSCILWATASTKFTTRTCRGIAGLLDMGSLEALGGKGLDGGQAQQVVVEPGTDVACGLAHFAVARRQTILNRVGRLTAPTNSHIGRQRLLVWQHRMMIIFSVQFWSQP